MSTYYMRVEAVNLAHVVYDTHDISTIRGGSFLLLDAITAIGEQFRHQLEPISTAASQGLFQLSAGEQNHEILQQQILVFLHQRTGGHATFLTAVVSDMGGNFSAVLEHLEANIHRQQWRMPTVRVPVYDPTDQECYVDGWRPGVVTYAGTSTPSDAKVSAATDFRRRAGRRLKHQMFNSLLPGVRLPERTICAEDLGELAFDPNKGVLNGKIAFIHVDGNSFGRVRRALCKTAEDRKSFDHTIQAGYRQPFLAALLEQAFMGSGFQTGADLLRLEVLLWGGDEMTLIVPAWKGWQVLNLFFAHAHELSFKDQALSHRAAMIFCHHNAPILQVRRLAEALLAQTKESIKHCLHKALTIDPTFALATDSEKQRLLDELSSHAYGNAAHYLVLESFDMLRGSLDDFLQRYYHGVSPESLLVSMQHLPAMLQALRVIRAYTTRSKVLAIIQVLQASATEQQKIHRESVSKQQVAQDTGVDSGPLRLEEAAQLAAVQQAEQAQIQQIETQMESLIASSHRPALRSAIATLIADTRGRWYIVADLWDYLAE